MLLSDQIKTMAPGHAVYYRLKLLLSDGTERVFPPEAGFFHIGESPYGIPSSQFLVYFFDEEYRPITHGEQKIYINLQNPTHQPNQLNLHLLNAQGSPTKPGLHTPQGWEEPRGVATKPAPSVQFPGEVDLEFRRHLHAMDMEERQQEFIKNSTYVTEVAELFTVNRLMRREMLELHRIIVQHSQSAYQDIAHVKGTIHELMSLQKAVLEHAATQIAKPPMPPPDYVGLGHSALSVIKEIGVALIQRSQSKEPGERRLDSKEKPQLTAPEAQVDRAPAEKQPDVLTQMVTKLQRLTDVDLANAMSSPETWKSLLDELRALDKSTEGKATDATAQGAQEIRS